MDSEETIGRRFALSVPEDVSPNTRQNLPRPNSTISQPEEAYTDDEQPLRGRAYAKLQEEKPELMEEYEHVLTKTTDLQRNLRLNETMKAVADDRLRLMTNRQWKIRIPW